MDITTIQIASWIQSDKQRKIRAERRQEFFGRVRKIFSFFVGATLFVFALTFHKEIQDYASAKLGLVASKTPGSDQIRQGAGNYEKQVDEIARSQ